MSFDEKYYQLFEFDLRFEKARLRIEDFGSRILLEQKEMNNIGENVLVLKENSFQKPSATSIQTAINIIINSIDNNSHKLLKGYCLSDVADTMKTVWQGLELYEA